MFEFYQRVVKEWTHRCFGAEQSGNLDQRGLRLGEETIECMQAIGIPEEQVLHMVKYVYSRPAGAIGQEIGGVGVTLIALCNALRKDLHVYIEQEILRVLDIPVEKFTKRNQEKNDAGLIARNIKE